MVGAAGLLTSIRFGNYSYPFAKLDYDLYGRLVRVQGGGGTGVSYTYGTRDELRTVQADGLNPESFDYTCCGRVKQWTKPDGTQVQFTYRPTGEVTQITVNGTPYSTYTYDAAGRLLTASNEAGSIQFTYDAHTGRLMQEAVAAGDGAMAAILGLSAHVVSQLCAQAANGEVLVPANLNGAGQVVVSGHARAVERLMARPLRWEAER